MKRKIIYTDAPPEIEEAFEHAVRIKNFLPAPEFLVFRKSKEETISTNSTFRTNTHTRSNARKFAMA